MEYELPLTIDDNEVAVRDLDGQQPFPECVQALHGGENADDLLIDVADRDDKCHCERMAEIGLVDLRHVGLPAAAHPLVPVSERVATAVDLGPFRLGRPNDSGWIGEKYTIELRKSLVQLAQMDQGFPPVSELDALAEPETARGYELWSTP